MNLPDILNVAIGLVAVYLLLSSIASLLLELLTGWAQYREEILYVTVNRLLAGVPDSPWNLTQLVLDRIGRRLPADHSWFGVARWLRARLVHEYQVGAPATANCPAGREDIVQRFWKHPKIRSLAAPGADAPPSMEAATFASVVIDVVVPRDAQRVLPDNRLKLLRAMAAPSEVAPPALMQTLRTLALSSEIPAGATGQELWKPFRTSIATWYNEANARATDIYRHTMQRLLLYLGLLLAFILNADTIRIIHLLSHDRPLREAVSAYAETLVAEKTVVAAAGQPAENGAEQKDEIQKTRKALGQDLERLRALEQMGFPIGWNGPDQGIYRINESFEWAYASVLGPWLAVPLAFGKLALLKLLGLGLTALAVSLGAPFWYGVMNRLIGLKKGQTESAPAADADPKAKTAELGESPAQTEQKAAMPLEIGYDLARPASGYCPRKAYWLARAAAAAYSPRREIESLTKETWKFHDCYYFDQQGTQGFCAVDDETVLLAFRGTELEELNDILTDVNAGLDTLKLAEYKEAPVRQVHKGFHAALDHVWPDLRLRILAWTEPKSGLTPRMIYITGHSLGGALATLAFARLASDPVRPVPMLYTFGCPKVGDAAFARELDRQYPERVFRFVNDADIVPLLPPLPSYHHAGIGLKFDKGGKLQTRMSGLSRLLGHAAGAAVDIRNAAKEAIDDHGMTHYVKYCEQQAKMA